MCSWLGQNLLKKQIMTLINACCRFFSVIQIRAVWHQFNIEVFNFSFLNVHSFFFKKKFNYNRSWNPVYKQIKANLTGCWWECYLEPHNQLLFSASANHAPFWNSFQFICAVMERTQSLESDISGLKSQISMQ